jgi:hypothetical protein
MIQQLEQAHPLKFSRLSLSATDPQPKVIIFSGRTGRK